MSKTVLITGASSGLGRATAQRFLDEGWNVVATMRSLQNNPFETSDRLMVTPLDVTDSKSIATAIDAAIERFVNIDVLVNNAGFGAFGPLESSSMDTIRRQMDVNVFGVLETTKAVLPLFRERGAGVIINVSSTSGRTTFPFGVLYHASKYAIEGATEALQYELAPLGVRVKLVEPGSINTDFAGRSLVFSNDPAIEAYQPLIGSAMPTYANFAELGSEPEQIATVIYTAATDDTSTLRYIAGDDAQKFLADRAAMSDDAYFASIRSKFNLPG